MQLSGYPFLRSFFTNLISSIWKKSPMASPFLPVISRNLSVPINGAFITFFCRKEAKKKILVNTAESLLNHFWWTHLCKFAFCCCGSSFRSEPTGLRPRGPVSIGRIDWEGEGGGAPDQPPGGGGSVRVDVPPCLMMLKQTQNKSIMVWIWTPKGREAQLS